MGLFSRMLARPQDNWCRDCKREMEEARRRLLALPSQTVGHYVEHTDPGYYTEELCTVGGKSDIPPGMYACEAVQYRCPQCGRRVTVLDPFLPVREEEKHEGTLVFEDRALDDFLWR